MQPDKNKMEPEAASDTWIAEVSHELRLPLANIKLLVETLLDGACDEPATARRMLTRAREEVTRLQNLVSDLLSHERLSERAFQGNKRLIPVKEKVRGAVDSTLALAELNKVKVVEDCPENMRLLADEDQLHQVLVNLLENAIKFTPAGGLVTVRATVNPPVIEVEDTGIGIAESEIQKIFQRFYRVDRSKTRGSTGLGLSIVKHIVDLHDAKISVTSKEGHGSRFSIEFPPVNLDDI